MKVNIFLVSLIFTALVSTSCNSKKSKAVSSQQLDMTEPFDITYSEGGGLTGLVEFYHITSTGTVEFFQKRPGQQDSLMWSKEVPTHELAKLQQSLVSSTILDQPLNDKGNMTSSLTYATADTSYSLFWSGAGAASDVSPELKAWLAQLKNLFKP